VITPDLTGFDIYTDTIAPMIRDASWVAGGRWTSTVIPAGGRRVLHPL